METVATQLLQRLHKGSTAVAFASEARWQKKGREKKIAQKMSSQPASVVWSGGEKKIKPQSISVRAADKQASLGFSQIKKARLPQSPRLAPMKQTPLLCERFRDGSILLFWALTSRSEGGYDSAACGEK